MACTKNWTSAKKYTKYTVHSTNSDHAGEFQGDKDRLQVQRIRYDYAVIQTILTLSRLKYKSNTNTIQHLDLSIFQ